VPVYAATLLRDSCLGQATANRNKDAAVHLHDFDFTLPPELIAQAPAARRDQSRLLIVDRSRQCLMHDVFANIGTYLRPNDVLVVNDTKVIPARLRGHKVATGGRVEVLLLYELSPGTWEVLLRPVAKVPPGTLVEFGNGLLRGEVMRRQQDGSVRMRFTPPGIHALLEQCGEVPLPPYIKRPAGALRQPLDLQRYQTVYARHPGAVAAPTAGLHFTEALLAELAQRGIHRAAITLHVGWGTFQPIRTEVVEHHRMGQEYYCLAAADATVIQQARAVGGRVVAVGTTVTRTLETIAHYPEGFAARSGWSELFIYPGYQFQIVEALVTNFHLPRSTLFLLVCAFAGRELMLAAYRTAIAERYRFYSYGDAMLIQ
jgi:S-adenosylmethionine:tRNA ribosyltransferase-isomerase